MDNGWGVGAAVEQQRQPRWKLRNWWPTVTGYEVARHSSHLDYFLQAKACAAVASKQRPMTEKVAGTIEATTKGKTMMVAVAEGQHGATSAVRLLNHHHYYYYYYYRCSRQKAAAVAAVDTYSVVVDR